MHHRALEYKFPYTAFEQQEIRGALLTALARIIQLERQINALNSIAQIQIREIEELEKLCLLLSPP